MGALLGISGGNQQSSGSQSGSQTSSGTSTSTNKTGAFTGQQLQGQNTAYGNIFGSSTNPVTQKGLNTALDNVGTASNMVTNPTLTNGQNQYLSNVYSNTLNPALSAIDTQAYGPNGMMSQITNQMADRGMGSSSVAAQNYDTIAPYVSNATAQAAGQAGAAYNSAALALPFDSANSLLSGAGAATSAAGAGTSQQMGSLNSILSLLGQWNQMSIANSTNTGATTSKGTSTGNYTGNMTNFGYNAQAGASNPAYSPFGGGG